MSSGVYGKTQTASILKRKKEKRIKMFKKPNLYVWQVRYLKSLELDTSFAQR